MLTVITMIVVYGLVVSGISGIVSNILYIFLLLSSKDLEEEKKICNRIFCIAISIFLLCFAWWTIAFDAAEKEYVKIPVKNIDGVLVAKKLNGEIENITKAWPDYKEDFIWEVRVKDKYLLEFSDITIIKPELNFILKDKTKEIEND